MVHKSGFVSILGVPNVGKSTLMNALVGERLSIITSKVQTTRHRIMGVVNGEEFQVVYSDTPGIIKPDYKLHNSMMKFVNTAITDADVLLYVTDIRENVPENNGYIEKIRKVTIPVILVINKIDLGSQEILEKRVEEWRLLLPASDIIPLSATERFNLDVLFDRILELLPHAPPYYPKDTLTDKPERFFASEIIREKVFMNYQKEIPYSTEIEIEEFKDGDDILHIRALVHVMRDTQKGIIIGSKGMALKKTGTDARLEMEKFFGKKVFLELFVKVNKEWRQKDYQLRRFGYR